MRKRKKKFDIVPSNCLHCGGKLLNYSSEVKCVNCGRSINHVCSDCLFSKKETGDSNPNMSLNISS